MLGIFGPNVSTVRPLNPVSTVPLSLVQVDGPDWQRQRKVVATPFNEALHRTVWTESLSQTKNMLTTWTTAKGAGTKLTSKDLKTLTLNVLAVAGFGKTFRFHGAGEIRRDQAPSDKDALAIVLDNALLMMIAPPWLLKLPVVPRAWRRIGRATVDFKQYMVRMIQEEKGALSQDKPGASTMINAFVRASEDMRDLDRVAQDNERQGRSKPKALTSDEIWGNIFILNFAGHDTTANALTYTLMLLSIFTDMQDWIAEEIQEVLPEKDSKQWTYETAFPRLKRCQCALVSRLTMTFQPTTPD